MCHFRCALRACANSELLLGADGVGALLLGADGVGALLLGADDVGVLLLGDDVVVAVSSRIGRFD